MNIPEANIDEYWGYKGDVRAKLIEDLKSLGLDVKGTERSLLLQMTTDISNDFNTAYSDSHEKAA